MDVFVQRAGPPLRSTATSGTPTQLHSAVVRGGKKTKGQGEFGGGRRNNRGKEKE